MTAQPPLRPEERQREFVEVLRSLNDGGRMDLWRVFRDFLDMGWCAVAKLTSEPERAEAFEARYLRTAKPYRREQMDGMARLLGMTALACLDDRRDFLGHVYEAEGFCEGKYGGQYWTPEHVCRLMAGTTIQPSPERPITTIGEPCCGSGRMVFAACAELESAGVDVPTRVWVEATDLDAACAHMTYLQMAYMKIPGVVRHANSLTLELFDWAVTPAGVELVHESADLRAWLEAKHEAPPAPAAEPEPPAQRDLFA